MAIVTKTTPMKFEITFDPTERRTLDFVDDITNPEPNDEAEAQLNTVIQRWLEGRLQARRSDWARKNFVG